MSACEIKQLAGRERSEKRERLDGLTANVKIETQKKEVVMQTTKTRCSRGDPNSPNKKDADDDDNNNNKHSF